MGTERASDYRINQSLFRVAYGDITDLSTEAIVSSDDTYLSMGGGVSMAIATKAGDAFRAEARKHVPLRAGDVVVTSAGDLKARYVFHAATIDYDRMVLPDETVVGRATAKCLQLAETLGVRTIAFPALGTGVGRFPFNLAAETMLKTIVDHLNGPTNIQLVELSLWTRDGVGETDLNLFYERSVAIASVLAESQSLGAIVADLKTVIMRSGRTDLLDAVSQLESRLNGARDQVARVEGPGDDSPFSGGIAMGATFETRIAIERDRAADGSVPQVEDGGNARAFATLGRVGQDSVAISDHVSEELEAWSDRQLSMELARTKFAALSTQLNTNVAVLNKFEIEKAKYGGIGVPPRLDFAIDELQEKVVELESELASAQRTLASLSSH